MKKIRGDIEALYGDFADDYYIDEELKEAGYDWEDDDPQDQGYEKLYDSNGAIVCCPSCNAYLTYDEYRQRVWCPCCDLWFETNEEYEDYISGPHNSN